MIQYFPRLCIIQNYYFIGCIPCVYYTPVIYLFSSTSSLHKKTFKENYMSWKRNENFSLPKEVKVPPSFHNSLASFNSWEHLLGNSFLKHMPYAYLRVYHTFLTFKVFLILLFCIFLFILTCEHYLFVSCCLHIPLSVYVYSPHF